MELRKDDRDLLERMVDLYSVQSVVEALSAICSDKSLHIAENWQDTASAKGWMAQSKHLDALAAKWEQK